MANLGILHRDISDWNVLLLRSYQNHTQREPDEERKPDPEELKRRFGPMAESEAKLRGYLDKLNRPLSAVVLDCDSQIMSSEAHTSIQYSKDDEITVDMFDIRRPAPDSEAPSKRRKMDTGNWVPVTASSDVKGKDEAQQSSRPGGHNYRRTPKSNNGHPVADFQTVSV